MYILSLSLLISKCAAENMCDKPHPPMCCHGYQLPLLHNGRKICTRIVSCPAPFRSGWRKGARHKTSTRGAWALRLCCASVGGSEQAVSSTSCLREPTLCIQSCLLLDFEASAELEEAEISNDTECFGSPQAFMDDCETQQLSDRRSMQATKQ